MKKILFFILIILSLFVFLTTHDYRSITQITFVNSIGIDYNIETDEFTMYFFILNNYTFAQTGNSASFTNTHAYTAKETDKTILGAENKIRNNSNTKFDLRHVRSLVLSEDFFTNNNLKHLMNYFVNNINYNPSFEVYTTSDDLSELYKIEHFSEVSGYYTILVNTQNNIPVNHVTYNNLCNDILIPDYTVAYQKIKLKKGVIESGEEKYVSLNFDGCSFINESNQLTSFKYMNLHGLGYFVTNSNRSIVIKNNNDVYNFLPNKFKIKHYIKNNKLLIKIDIDGTFFNNNLGLYENELKNILINKIKSDIIIMNETFVNYDIDYFNISYRYKNKYNYKEIELDFEFNINLI